MLAQTNWPGLKGPEIGRLLEVVNIDDPWPTATKHKRLGAALVNRQVLDQSSHRLITFIVQAMAPSRYISDPDRFAALQAGVNEVLSMVGLRINDRGQMARATQSRTLDEVAQLTGRLRGELTRRGVHTEVLRYCEHELLRRSTFHAVFEAAKGLSERLRQMSGSTLDGADLVNYCFTKQAPVICINNNATRSEVSEQVGFANLLRGIVGTFRNPTAHTPRTEWLVSEPDALDFFAMLSYMHRRLDGAAVSRRI
ncbi:TIGR02391 family protein [Modestobacter sp. VKM Ac-2984]|uniref:TIGR02391 family protein n=1 Tax=Modestobacter sp. VKM Ac-2984 TaxID=3004138 RepID=UPI0022AAFF73|nr:TIGR02391 family protein [Modestobacter sp. VKM Ac-2984]MCZ2818304.1 TIGR02391 family protein [Modestobacter sp. VKM Ac-2984]